jgi:hypothetical protein
MTDKITLVHNNIKHFGKLVSCYQYPTGIENEPVLCHSCYSAWLECGNNHSFKGNFEDAITLIDLLPDLFPEIFKSNKLQDFVN